jgi:hypothetical protein
MERPWIGPDSQICSSLFCDPPSPPGVVPIVLQHACPPDSYLERVANGSSTISGRTPATTQQSGFASFSSTAVVCTEKQNCATGGNCVFNPGLGDFICVVGNDGEWNTVRTYYRLQGSGPSCEGTVVPVPVEDTDPIGSGFVWHYPDVPG